MFKRNLQAILFVLSCISLSTAQNEQDYNWKNVPIGGGGYITGMQIHPLDSDMRIYRTDVGGAYRYDINTGRMVQLIYSTESDHYSVAGIALHPTDTDIVYLALGRNCTAAGSAIYQSTDGGLSFTELSVSGDNDFYFSGNGGRNCPGNSDDKDREGTPIAINPNNTNELYLGTTDNGLYILDLTTLQATQIPNNQIPHNTNRKSIRSVVFHPTEDLVYIAYPSEGIFIGNTITQEYTLVNNSAAALDVIDISLSKNADYLVAACRREGILKCEDIINGTNWSSLSNGLDTDFSDNADQNNRGFLTVDCSPHDNDNIITVTADWNHIDEFYVTTNGGDLWSRVDGDLPDANSAFKWRDVFGAHIAQIAFDPSDDQKMHFTSWFSTFQCDNFSFTNGGTWGNLQSKGHEEIVPTDLMCFPTNSKGNFLISGSADHSGFIFDADIDDIESFQEEDISDKTNDNLGKLKKSASYAFCENQSDHLALLITDEWTPNEGGLLTSSDGGNTWSLKPGYDSDDLKSVVEMSSDDPDNIVIFGHNGLKYSEDGGDTDFIAASGTTNNNPDCTLPFSVTCLASTDVNTGNFNSSVFNVYRNIAADKEVPCVFYFYDWNGTFSISTNGGKDWCVVHNDTSQLPANTDNWTKARMFTVPGHAGHIWINIANKLYFSDDAGASWTNKSNTTSIDKARSITFGKGVSDSYPAIYVYGEKDTDTTDYYYRSDDMGETWTRINNYGENELWVGTKIIAGDRNIAGRLYSAVSGQGVVFGDDTELIDVDECGSEELVISGEFDNASNTIPNFNLHDGGTALASGSVNGMGEAHIAITNGGSFDYDVQMWQDDLAIESGETYLLTTIARADTPRDIVIKLRNKADGSIVYHETELSLTQSHQVFTHEFTAPNDDNNLRLTHLVGASTVDVYFDVISMKHVTGSDADGDGVCDADDLCPILDDSLIGTPCDDGDPCTANDVYTANCGCEGTGSSEIVTNGTFDNPSSNIPDFNVHDGGSAIASGSVNAMGEAHIEIANGGSFNYDVQLWQDDLEIVAGETYILTTIARADTPKEISIKLRNKTDGSILYHDSELALTQSHQVFTHVFVAPNDDDDVRLTHLVGSDDVDVYFDVISLKNANGTDADGDGICDAEDPCVFCADLTMSQTLIPTIVNGPTDTYWQLRINETEGSPTEGTISVVLSNDARLEIFWDPTEEQIGPFTLNNAVWTYDDSNPSFHLWTTDYSIIGNSNIAFGFIANYDPEQTSGVSNFTCTIITGSGGEENGFNNIDSETILYFPD